MKSLLGGGKGEKTDETWIDKYILKKEFWRNSKEEGPIGRGNMTFASENDMKSLAEYLKTHFAEDLEMEKAFKHFRNEAGARTFNISFEEDAQSEDAGSRAHAKYVRAGTGSKKSLNKYTMSLKKDHENWFKYVVLSVFRDSNTADAIGKERLKIPLEIRPGHIVHSARRTESPTPLDTSERKGKRRAEPEERDPDHISVASIPSGPEAGPSSGTYKSNPRYGGHAR